MKKIMLPAVYGGWLLSTVLQWKDGKIVPYVQIFATREMVRKQLKGLKEDCDFKVLFSNHRRISIELLTRDFYNYKNNWIPSGYMCIVNSPTARAKNC